MIPMQHTEEVLSIAYVKSVVSHYGHTYTSIDQDYGTDGCVRRIKKIGEEYIDLGTQFDCQLKSTIDWEIKEKTVSYDMRVDAYNRLIERNNGSDIPCLLILLCLPKKREDWLDIGEDSFKLQNCCYYTLINGEKTANTEKKRVFIPRSNLFNIHNLDLLFNDFSKAMHHD
jgi:hypothetical protein